LKLYIRRTNLMFVLGFGGKGVHRN
jgi:hypothetical protein